MQKLENVLKEIESVGNIQFSSYTKPLIAVEDVIKIIRAHIPLENDAEIARSSRDNDGWIPVEERLPEEAGTYIINALTGERNIVTFAKWQNRYKRFDMTGARTYWKIIAWCPLPEPYRPERSEGE